MIKAPVTITYSLPDSIQPAELEHVDIGFVPLLDSAPLIIARELGFFDAAGVSVNLKKQTSWAAVQDKLQYQLLDAAPLPASLILSSQSIRGKLPLVTAMGLGLNGNGITASRELWQHLNQGSEKLTPELAGKRLAQYLKRSGKKLRASSVHSFSSHHLLLRQWLSRYLPPLEESMEFSVIPPSKMVAAMKAGDTDLFCVGEPWNTVALQSEAGFPLFSSFQLWPDAPDKMLAVTQQWHSSYPNTHLRLIWAITNAMAWLEEHKTDDGVASILSHPEHLDLPSESLSFEFGRHSFRVPEASRPKLRDAEWFQQQLKTLLPIESEFRPADIQSTWLTDFYDRILSH